MEFADYEKATFMLFYFSAMSSMDLFDMFDSVKPPLMARNNLYIGISRTGMKMIKLVK
jgi:hypothetical protein